MCVAVGVGEGGPSLVLLCCFFQDKAKGPLLADRPCPLFPPGYFPVAMGKCDPSGPKAGDHLRSVVSLSTHSHAAGGQQGLSKLSDPRPERSGRKGVQPVACKALVGTC